MKLLWFLLWLTIVIEHCQFCDGVKFPRRSNSVPVPPEVIVRTLSRNKNRVSDLGMPNGKPPKTRFQKARHGTIKAVKAGAVLAAGGTFMGLGFEVADLFMDWIAKNDEIVYRLPEEKQKPEEEKIGCAKCKRLVVATQQAFKKGEDVEEAMKAECTLGPEKVKENCYLYVKQAWNSISLAVAKKKTEDEICYYIWECNWD